MYNFERQMEARQARRMKAEDRFLGRQEKLEAKAAPLIGELCREGAEVYYINVLDRNGKPTGKTKESSSYYELVEYLIRNKYIGI